MIWVGKGNVIVIQDGLELLVATPAPSFKRRLGDFSEGAIIEKDWNKRFFFIYYLLFFKLRLFFESKESFFFSYWNKIICQEKQRIFVK